MIKNDVVTGVVTQMGLTFSADKVILTSGTFVGGIIHIGQKGNFDGHKISTGVIWNKRLKTKYNKIRWCLLNL